MNMNPSAPFLPTLTARQVFRGTLVVVGVGLGFWLLYLNSGAVFSLFLAMVLSTAISPAVAWLRRRGLPSGAGVVLLYVSLLVLIVGVILLVVPLVTVQGPKIAAAFASLYSAGLAQLRQSPSALVQRVASQFPTTLQPVLPTGAGTDTLGAVAGLLTYLGLVGNGLFIGIAVLVLAFYWTLDRDRLVRWLLLFVPMQHRDPARLLFEASEAKVGAYIRGSALLCLTVGVLSLCAYWLIGLPNALLLGLLAGLLEVVPIVGPALGALPAIAVALTGQPGQVVWVLVAMGAIQLVENTFLVPRVMGHTVGVNPVVTLLSLAAFGTLFGLPGALMAIPIAAVIQLLLDQFVLGPAATDRPMPPGRDRLSVLRYDTQELVQDIRKQAREKPEQAGAEIGEELEDKLEALAADLEQLLAQTTPELEAKP
jgi:predicted PurR-regulated permease PerM